MVPKTLVPRQSPNDLSRKKKMKTWCYNTGCKRTRVEHYRFNSQSAISQLDSVEKYRSNLHIAPNPPSSAFWRSAVLVTQVVFGFALLGYFGSSQNGISAIVPQTNTFSFVGSNLLSSTLSFVGSNLPSINLGTTQAWSGIYPRFHSLQSFDSDSSLDMPITR